MKGLQIPQVALWMFCLGCPPVWGFIPDLPWCHLNQLLKTCKGRSILSFKGYISSSGCTDSDLPEHGGKKMMQMLAMLWLIVPIFDPSFFSSASFQQFYHSCFWHLGALCCILICLMYMAQNYAVPPIPSSALPCTVEPAAAQHLSLPLLQRGQDDGHSEVGKGLRLPTCRCRWIANSRPRGCQPLA